MFNLVEGGEKVNLFEEGAQNPTGETSYPEEAASQELGVLQLFLHQEKQYHNSTLVPPDEMTAFLDKYKKHPQMRHLLEKYRHSIEIDHAQIDRIYGDASVSEYREVGDKYMQPEVVVGSKGNY